MDNKVPPQPAPPGKAAGRRETGGVMNLQQLDELEMYQDRVRSHYLRLLDLAKRTRAKGIPYHLSKREAWEVAKDMVRKENSR